MHPPGLPSDPSAASRARGPLPRRPGRIRNRQAVGDMAGVEHKLPVSGLADLILNCFLSFYTANSDSCMAWGRCVQAGEPQENIGFP